MELQIKILLILAKEIVILFKQIYLNIFKIEFINRFLNWYFIYVILCI